MAQDEDILQDAKIMNNNANVKVKKSNKTYKRKPPKCLRGGIGDLKSFSGENSESVLRDKNTFDQQFIYRETKHERLKNKKRSVNKNIRRGVRDEKDNLYDKQAVS